MSVTKQEFFCSAAWTSIYIHTDGRVSPCCISTANLGNINETDLGSIMRGPKATKMRERMLANQAEPTCQSCWRQNQKYRLQDSINQRYVDSPSNPDLDDRFYSNASNFSAKYLDFRWNNTCNFACIYCGPDLSSLWADLESSQSSTNIPIKKPTRVTKEEILDWTNDNLATVEDIQLAGGEPLMIKENLVLLDQVKKINPECRILVNTNLSQLENNLVFERLKELPNVRWLISGEATGQQWEYIRWQGHWETFKQNLFVIKDLGKIGHKINFNLVGMNINCFSIWEYIDFLLDNEIARDPADIRMPLQHHRDATHPFALQRLPEEFKNRVREHVAKKNYPIPELQNYLIHLDEPVPDNLARWSGLEATIQSLQKIDRARKLDSRSVFFEIYQYVSRNLSQGSVK